MTTVSLVECVTPVSLRTCGSSVSSLVYNRQRLQCFSPVKRVSALRTYSPEVRRGSVSPTLGLQGALVSSPLPSPTPRQAFSQFSRCHSKATGIRCYDSLSSISSSSSSSLSENDFSSSDELEEPVGPNFGELLVVGSKPKLHTLYDVPTLKTTKNVKPLKRKSPVINPDCTPLPGDDLDDDIDIDRASSTSPENPPPSPINFRPSIEGFVVGGRKLQCPEKSACSLAPSYSSRDFVPGFVKQPLYHCSKCEEKVVGQEQSEIAMQRRISCIMNSRASQHRYPGHRADHNEDRTCSSVQLPPTRQSYVEFTSQTLSENKSFIEIYEEKKREKEKRDREYKEQRCRRIARMNEEEMRKRERLRQRQDSIAYRSQLLKHRLSLRDNQQTERSMPIESRRNSRAQDDNIYSSEQHSELSDVTLPPISTGSKETQYKPNVPHSVIKDLASIETFEEHIRDKSVSPPAKMDNDATVGKWQMRRCWSDIWPFPEDYDVTAMGDSDVESTTTAAANAIGKPRSKCRISPFYPLLQNNKTRTDEETSLSKMSVMSEERDHVTSTSELIPVSEISVSLQESIPDVQEIKEEPQQDDCTDENAT